MIRWLCSLSLLLVIGTGTHADERPNLLLFLADDMTYTDLGCYGHPDVQTPHLDQLAKQGIRFTRFYSSAPTCSPCRQSLYTGLYPVRNGAHPNHSQVKDGVVALPTHLRKLGYRCGIVGKRHEAPAAVFDFTPLGGQHHDNGDISPEEELPLKRAAAFVKESKEQPWCLVVTSNQPHSPWNRGDATRYPPDQLNLPPYLVDTAETREQLSRYYAEITYMDQQVGRTFELADENTLVLWLSEQGAQFPFGKWTCYEAQAL